MWKTMGGRRIYEAPNKAKVYQNLLYRWLTFDSLAIQTLINRRHPNRVELSYIHQLTLAVRAHPTDCCLLGLGGAAVAHFLSPYLGSSQLVAVENDANIIEIATTYFMTNRLKNMSIIHQDAKLFLQESQTHYQHLLVDLFDNDSFPMDCNTHHFFEQCKRLLLPDGVLALNLANLDEQWSLFNHIRENFNQQTISLPVKGTANMVILACNSRSITPLLNIVTGERSLKKLTWDSKWGCIGRI